MQLLQKPVAELRETNDRIYTDLVTDHPDLTRYQVLNYCGRAGLIPVGLPVKRLCGSDSHRCD